EELKEETASGMSSAATAVAGKAAAGKAADGKPPGRRLWLGIAAGVAAVGALIAVLLILLPARRPAQEAFTEVPLTSYTGYQGYPSLSPDGTQFSFSWTGGNEGAAPQLYVSLIGRGTPLRLTNDPDSSALFGAWSPDGQTIAFVRRPGR